jgi:hypothetical protein
MPAHWQVIESSVAGLLGLGAAMIALWAIRLSWNRMIKR